MDEKPRPKLEYEPPAVKRIELRTEEVLSVGCKTEGGSSPGAVPCSFNNCAGLGS